MKYFSAFKFDDATATLVRGGQPVPLTRKAGELLRCLMDHAGASVPHETILSTVWPDAHVQPDNVKVLVCELRRALGDDARQPRFIRSIPARGYAFIASAAHAPPLDTPEHDRSVMFVNRHDELKALGRAMDLAPAAPCRIVLVEGERGIGKTALCDEFILMAGRRHGIRVARGQSVDQVASSHPYFPVAAALAQLARQFPDVLSALDGNAPGWLTVLRHSGPLSAEMPGLSPEPMARELVAAFEDLSRRATTVMVLEDLHWTDAATVALLRALVRCGGRPGLLIVVTCSPYGSAAGAAGLQQLGAELEASPGSERIRLGRLSPAAVRRYLALRFETADMDRLARPLYVTTQGHPFCLVAALDALMNAGHLHETGAGWRLDLPSRLLEPVLSTAVLSVLARQFEQLEEQDRLLLQAAAAVGIEFSLNDVSCALDAVDREAVRQRLDALVERRFVMSAERPEDEDVDYWFPHASHAEALLLNATPFQQLRVAERLAGVGERANDRQLSLRDA